MEFDGEVLKRCPRRPLLEEPGLWNDVLTLYQAWKQANVLPEPGGYMDQPSKLMAIFAKIDDTLAETKELKASQKKAAAQASSSLGVDRAPGKEIRSVKGPSGPPRLTKAMVKKLVKGK